MPADMQLVDEYPDMIMQKPCMPPTLLSDTAVLVPKSVRIRTVSDAYRRRHLDTKTSQINKGKLQRIYEEATLLRKYSQSMEKN